MSTSLIEIIKRRFLESIRSVVPANAQNQYKILVIDEHSQKLLTAALKTNDVLEEHVAHIEAINSRRPPQAYSEAMYLVMPTSANVNRIIADFSGNQPQYMAAHIFFIDGLPEPLFQRLLSSPVEPYLKNLVDLFLNFNAFESRVFNIHSPEMFYSFLSPPRDPDKLSLRLQRLDNELRFCSKILLNICVSLNENPLVRYYQAPHHGPLGPLAGALPPPSGSHNPSSRMPAPPQGSSRYYSAEAAAPPAESGLRWARQAALRATEAASSSSLALMGGSSSNLPLPMGDGLAKKLATMFQAELDEYRNANKDFPKPDGGRPRGTLIITDRTMDLMAPYLNEFTYQAMANDLLPIENGRAYRYKFASNNAPGGYEEATAILSEQDALWAQVRHLHIQEAAQKISTDFSQFLEENGVFNSSAEAATMNDVKDMLAGLPQFSEQREKFSAHISMSQKCLDIFKEKNLTATANVQQTCATGLTAEGKAPKRIVEDMVTILAAPEVSSRDKVRIIALYIMFRDGVPEEDQRRLFQHARLSLPEQDAVKNLVRLGVRMNRASGDKDTKKPKFKSSKKDDEDEEYDLSRYKPALHHVLVEHINGRLDQTLFPYVRDAPTSYGQSFMGGGGASSTAAVPAAGASLRSLGGGARGARVFGGGGPSSNGASSPASSAPSSLRSARPAANRPTRPGLGGGDGSFGSMRSGAGSMVEKEPIRQRVIVFVAGGMTYSEMRTAYQVGAKLARDVYIGSTHAITPERFIEDMKSLEIEGVGSMALPQGLPMSGPANGHFQDYYDKRYYTPDAPAPPPPPPSSGGGGGSGRGGEQGMGGGRMDNNMGRRPGPGTGGGGGMSPMPSSSSVPTKEKEKKKRFLGF
ncbi:Sec1-like protein [Clavulina sp. PMI_390]|nr:Sec1-like protein [Clavulina sp. PMI_390]